MSILDFSGFDCPQYVHLLDVSKASASSGSYFDASQSELDVSPKEMACNVMAKSTNSEVKYGTPHHYQDSLNDPSGEDKENQGTLICSEDEFENSNFCEEMDSPYHFRNTPARQKRRGTGAFSSSKKMKISSVSIGNIANVNRQLFDAQRISTPLMRSCQVTNHENLLNVSIITNDVEIQCSPLSSVQCYQDSQQVVSRTTRSSSRQNESSEMSSNVSGIIDFTQDEAMFPVQNTRTSGNEQLVQRTSNTAEIESQGAMKKVKPVTFVKPFNFAEPIKRKRDGTNDYVPLAEQVANFQTKTPQRFHTSSNVFKPSGHWSPRLVIPQSPNLQARKRVRGKTVLSQLELEDKEVENMKQYKFRARAFDPKLINPYNKIKNKRKSLTKPVDVKLHTSERSALQLNFKSKVEENYEFHALPVPKDILNRPVGIKEKKVLPTTVPESPMFALKDRSRKWKAIRTLNQDVPKPVFKFSAPKAVKIQAPFQVKHELKITEIEPFSFDQRDKERYEKRDQKIKMEIEKSLSRTPFKAQPLPSPLPAPLKEVKKRELTKLIPFSFDVERSCEKRKKTVEEEKIPQFKAMPATVLSKPAFVPEKAITHLSVEPFALHTDKRAAERAQQKEIQDALKEEQEQELLRRQEKDAAAEKQQLLEMRKLLVHKAQPIRQFKPAEKVPPKKATEAISPQFATNARLKTRSMMQ